MEVPFPHKAKKLQACLDDHKSQAAVNNAEGDIQKPEENDIFYVPKPFKTKRSHLFSPLIKFDNLVKSRKILFSVIPAKAGIQCFQEFMTDLDPGFRRGASLFLH